MRLLPWFLLVTVLGLGVWGYGCEQKRQGGLKAKIAELKKQSRVIDTVYKTQTKTLVKVRRVTDSVVSTDTVFRDTTVRRLILGERQACDNVIQTCESQVKNLNAQIKKLTEQRPGFLKRTGGKLVWFGAGMLAGKLILN